LPSATSGRERRERKKQGRKKGKKRWEKKKLKMSMFFGGWGGGRGWGVSSELLAGCLGMGRECKRGKEEKRKKKEKKLSSYQSISSHLLPSLFYICDIPEEEGKGSQKEKPPSFLSYSVRVLPERRKRAERKEGKANRKNPPLLLEAPSRTT